jgi:hypothetical protein
MPVFFAILPFKSAHRKVDGYLIYFLRRCLCTARYLNEKRPVIGLDLAGFSIRNHVFCGQC